MASWGSRLNARQGQSTRRSGRSRTRVCALSILVAGVVFAGLGWAQTGPDTPPTQVDSDDPDALAEARSTAFEELTPEALDAIERGVEWLAREQIDTSGRWPCRPTHYQMSVTALAGLALLAHGDSASTGPYCDQIRRAIEWILRSQWTEGPDAGLYYEGRDVGDSEARAMHGHGFALLFMAQAFGQVRDERLADAMAESIRAAVNLTERSISPEGGWYYAPRQQRDEGSVTITQIQGLRAARNAGFNVNANVVDRAVRYIKRSQQPDGGVRYTLRWGKTSAALTAAGIAVLQGAGEYHSEAIDDAYAYLRQNLKTDADEAPFFYYTHLYASQAMFQRGGPSWATYFPGIRRELLAMRPANRAYWDSPYGESYGTANALLILQLPKRYLPIFQR